MGKEIISFGAMKVKNVNFIIVKIFFVKRCRYRKNIQIFIMASSGKKL